MVSVLERVLQTSKGTRLTRKHPLDPQLVWKLHKVHATSSTTSSNIYTSLSQELAKTKINEFHYSTKGMNTFDSYVANFNKVSKGSPIPDSLSIMYLKSTSHGNKKLLSAWTQFETMTETLKPGTTPTYEEYYEYLLGYTKKLEAAVTDNITNQKANAAESDYLQPYSPSDACYNDATKLSTYMIERGEDVDMIQDVLQCNQAMNQGKPRPPPITRQEPLCQELRIKDPTWSGLKPNTRQSWARESNNNKEKIIAQFVAEFKSSTPVTKNQYLRTVYRIKFDDNDWYESDFTANSESTFQFNVNSAMFDTTANNNSNEEIVIEGINLNVNVAVATKKIERLSILKGKGRRSFKSSEMPAGAVGKMMANKQFKVLDPITKNVQGWMAYSAKAANIDCS